MLAILHGIYELVERYLPHGRVTIGDIKVEPGVINTVPGRLTLKVDLRHPDEGSLDAMDQALFELVKDVVHSTGLKCEVENIWYSPPVVFDPDCIESVRKAAQYIDAVSMDIVSGAGHDAVYVSQVAPTSMIFIPCKDGLSHNELESVKKVDAIAGANVLLQALLYQALT
jgi:N-carbamoyl-L-amino-acid hydrolase